MIASSMRILELLNVAAVLKGTLMMPTKVNASRLSVLSMEPMKSRTQMAYAGTVLIIA